MKRLSTAFARRSLPLWLTIFAKTIFVAVMVALPVNHFLLQSYYVADAAMAPTIAVGDRIWAGPLPVGAKIPFTRAQLVPGATPRRGDLVVVQAPYADDPHWTDIIFDPLLRLFSFGRLAVSDLPWNKGDSAIRDATVLRRVIAVGGDRVAMDGYRFKVFAYDGSRFLDESFLAATAYDIIDPSLQDRTAESTGSENSGARRFNSLLGGLFLAGTGTDDPTTGTADAVGVVYNVPPGHVFVAADDRGGAFDSRHWGAVPTTAIRATAFFRYAPLPRLGGIR